MNLAELTREPIEAPHVGWLCGKCKKPTFPVEVKEWPAFKNSKCCDAPAYRIYPWDTEAKLFAAVGDEEDEPVEKSISQELAERSTEASKGGNKAKAALLLQLAFVANKLEKDL